MARKKEVLDNGYLVIEKDTPTVAVTSTASVEPVMAITRTMSFSAPVQRSISVLDYLDTALSYLADPVQVIAVDSTKKGACLLCGAETNKPERKICINCFKEHKSDIYESYKNAKANGSDVIEW